MLTASVLKQDANKQIPDKYSIFIFRRLPVILSLWKMDISPKIYTRFVLSINIKVLLNRLCVWIRGGGLTPLGRSGEGRGFDFLSGKSRLLLDGAPWSCDLTTSLPQPVKSPGWKVHTYTPANSIFDGPITNLLSTLCILIEILSRAQAKGAKKP